MYGVTAQHIRDTLYRKWWIFDYHDEVASMQYVIGEMELPYHIYKRAAELWIGTQIVENTGKWIYGVYSVVLLDLWYDKISDDMIILANEITLFCDKRDDKEMYDM